MIEGNSHQRGLGQSVDWHLVVVYLLLVFIGWLNIYASIHSTGPSSIFDFSVRSGKQFVWMLTAFGLAALILFVIPAHWWEGLAVPIFGGVLLLLIAVIFLGVEVKGSRSWFEFGAVRFQPAEISKISTSLMLAVVMSQTGYKMSRTRDLLFTLGTIVLPMLVILAESETGSALVYLGFIFVLYREGLSGWWLGLIGLVIVLFITTLTLSPYTSILILIGILTVLNAIYAPRGEGWTRFFIGAGFVLVMSMVPWLWGMLQDAVQAKMDWMANVTYVPQAHENGKYFWRFILYIKPLYILIALCVAGVPLLGLISYNRNDSVLGLSLAAFLVGILLVFSTNIIFEKVLQDHQRKRIEVLLGIKDDPSGVGYNVNQSKIAIGSGGFFGKGYLNGTQTTFGFVPEQTTDFIFCTVGEEWGFVGSLFVILLYVYLIARIVLDAEKCRAPFTRIYGYCVAACIFMHLFINIGMTIGLMPVIGIPLPLLSYGGSSLWAFTVLIFIFIAQYRSEKKYY